MKRALVLAFLVAGCGVPEESYDDVVTNLDDKADSTSAAKSALPPDAKHIYFETLANVYVSDDAPLSYTWFTANKGNEFKVAVSEYDENGFPLAGEHIGFKLQRAVKQNGKWSWSVVAQGESEEGSAGVKYYPTTGPGLYLVTATAAPLPAQLEIHLGCGGTNCATAPQPTQACTKRNTCDEGLFCSFGFDQQCGAGGVEGACAVKSQICPLFYNPVCGCDGHTYGNNCQAAGGGTSLNRVGPCEVNVVGAWRYINGAHYDYTFNADGTFISTDQPACAFGNPRCLVKIAPATGVYHVSATTLSLTYTSDFKNGQTADFAIQGKHLVGSDWGQKLDLTRVK